VLRTFIESVQPDEAREFTFRTSWGTGFKDSDNSVLFAKRCEHGGYSPAERVCAYLLKHGSTEFAGATVMAAISCLEPKTSFGNAVALNGGDFSFASGTDARGAQIGITFAKDPVVGGFAFRLVAKGY